MGKLRARSPELAQLAKRLYEELGSGNRVAKRLDLSHSATYRLLHDAGVELPDRHGPEVQQRKKALQGELAKAVARDYADGKRLAEIKEKYGVGTWAIRTAAKDAGFLLRNKGGRFRKFSDATRAEIVRLYKDGWTQMQIAARFTTHQPTIRELLIHCGVAIRDDDIRGIAKVGGGYLGEMVSQDDPFFCMASAQGYVLQHRLVMARALGRPLLEHETVHHINGDKTDNRFENLQLRFGKHGKGVLMICNQCGSHDITYHRLP